MKTKIRIYFSGVFIIFLMGLNPIAAQENNEVKEYVLKAAFLIRFVDYVYWEGYSKNHLFKIAVLGDCPITRSLTVAIKNKKIEVKEYKNLSDLRFTHILFVPHDSAVPLETILSKLSGKSVLIVTEKKDYGERGAHMNFVLLENKLKFEVNLKAINKAGIGISSFLLQHAIIIQ